MAVHKLTDAALTRATHRAYVNAAWNAVALLAASLFLIWKLHGRWTVLFVIGPILILGMWNAMRRAENLFRTYEIGLDEVGIWRQYRRALQERIPYKDLGQVIEVAGEGMLIRSADGRESIPVSDGVADYAEIRAKIASMITIQQSARRRMHVQLPATALIAVATVVAVVVFFTTPDPMIAGALGMVIISGLGIGTVVYLRRGGLSFGRIAAAMLAIAIAAVIALRVYLALTAGGWPAE